MQSFRDPKLLVMTALPHSHPEPLSSDTTTSVMESEVSNLTLLGDPKHGGALFTLPREVRDDIYRLLVKGRHTVYLPLEGEEGQIYGLKAGSVAFDKPDVVILQISRAISREAQEILCSESVFLYPMHFCARKALKPPAELVRRMKKVKMIVRDLASEGASYIYQDTHPSYKPRMAAICGATIDNFTGAQILREKCHVQFKAFKPDMIEPLSSLILPKLKDFNGFRTLLVEVCLEGKYEGRVRWEKSQNMGSEGNAMAGVERVRQAIKDAMEPTLGPATTINDGFKISLRFHPRQHVPTLLRAQAQKCLMDADRLEREG